MQTETIDELLEKIERLESRLAESEQLIDAIKAGEVDAFAVNENNQPEIYTLKSGDYAYRILIEEIGEGAVNISEDGLIVYTNSCFAEMLKLKYDTIIGKRITDFIHPDSVPDFNKLFKQALQGKSKGEIHLFNGTKIIPVYISLTSLQPKLATVGIIITDHSEKKRNEETIFQYQRELESKNIELAQNNVELTSFTYIASHDLQEPLRKIQTFCNRIIDTARDQLSPDVNDYFQRILSSSKRMQNLIDSLLSYSRMSSLDMNFETIDLNVIVTEVSINLQELVEENQVSIHSKNLPVIRGMYQQFIQLFTNLIMNSIKYRTRGHAPEIKVEAFRITRADLPDVIKPVSAHYWKLVVSDNGIGFEPQYGDKIFELFQRLHSRYEYEGTGVGLAICKKIVQNHKGFIRAIGRPDAGASFEIYLPIL